MYTRIEQIHKYIVANERDIFTAREEVTNKERHERKLPGKEKALNGLSSALKLRQ